MEKVASACLRAHQSPASSVQTAVGAPWRVVFGVGMLMEGKQLSLLPSLWLAALAHLQASANPALVSMDRIRPVLATAAGDVEVGVGEHTGGSFLLLQRTQQGW